MDVVETRFRKILVSQLGIDEELIESDSHLENDLGCDSLDLVEIIMAAEIEFNIDIYDEDVENLRTVDKCIEYIKRRMDEQGVYRVQ